MLHKHACGDVSMDTYTAMCHGSYNDSNRGVIWDERPRVDNLISAERRRDLTTAYWQVICDRILYHLGQYKNTNI